VIPKAGIEVRDGFDPVLFGAGEDVETAGTDNDFSRRHQFPKCLLEERLRRRDDGSLLDVGRGRITLVR
jgi:hypothetical protein